MIQFHKICGLFTGICLTCLSNADEGIDNKFYKPVIGGLEGWKIEWDPAIAESEDASFFYGNQKGTFQSFSKG